MPPSDIATRLARLTLLVVAVLIPAWQDALAQSRQPAARTPAPREVTVTEEMLGAGIVSSGVALPTPPPATGTRAQPVPSWGKPLPWPIIITDRRNNRLLEVTPDKRIVWEFPSPNLKVYRGNDDANFTADGNTLVVNEADNYDVHTIDYATRTLRWTYGKPDTRGRGPGYLNYPDDARMLPDGRIVVSDIRNCRIVFVDPKTSQQVGQWGKEGVCKHDPPRSFGYPNDAYSLDNGDLLVTEIVDAWITRLTLDGRVVWSVRAPRLRYPSDARPAADGNLIIADFSKPGGVVIFNPATGRLVWEYRVSAGEKMLDHPSLAIELPTGDILVNDDHRERVVVIDRQTKEIIWQYGNTDQRGHLPGYLWYPDSVELDYFHDWKAALGAKR